MESFNKFPFVYKYYIKLNEFLFRPIIIKFSSKLLDYCPEYSEQLFEFSKKLLLEPMHISSAKTSLGFRMMNNGRFNKIDEYIYYLGKYDPIFLEFAEKFLSPSDSILEIGAGSGFYSLSISNIIQNGFVYCSEDDESLFDKLQKNIFINSIKNIKSLHSLGLKKLEQEIPLIEKNKIKLVIFGDENILSSIKKTENLLITNGPALYMNFSRLKDEALTLDIYKKILDFGMYDIFKIDKNNSFTLKKIRHAGDLLFSDNILCLTKTHLGRLDKNTPRKL